MRSWNRASLLKRKEHSILRYVLSSNGKPGVNFNAWCRFLMSSNAIIVSYRTENTNRRQFSTKGLCRGWNMNLVCQRKMRRKPKHCG